MVCLVRIEATFCDDGFRSFTVCLQYLVMRAEPASLIITRQTQPKMRMMIVVKYFLLCVFLSFFFFSFSLIKPCCVEVSLLADVNRLVSICGHESFFVICADRRRNFTRERNIYSVKIKRPYIEYV